MRYCRGPSWKWVVLWSLWAARLARQPTAPVRVAGGLLRGALAPQGYAAYLAMPYATVQHRFQAATPVENWEGILDLYDENVRCTQRFSSTTISGREDCLTMNIYTPLPTAGAKPRPVMVFIHGGGFRDGSGSPFLYGPEYLLKHDVILVTFNYRLEILGFLCLGIEEAPGNVGMKDQVEALKWIKENIRAFGGDPDNITIFGESAGSASVSYHLMSPMSRGLFHKAIMESGSAMSPWAVQFEPLKTASLHAKQMGYDTEDPKELYEIFMSKTGEELLRTRVPRNVGDIVLAENIFVPCVEKDIPGIESFLTETPYDILTNGKFTKVPLITGFNDEEGYMFVAKENDTTISEIDFSKAMPRDLEFPSEKSKLETATNLKQLYMGDDDVSKETLIKFSRFEGESGITYPVAITSQFILNNSDQPVYIYKFCYNGWMNLLKLISGYSKAPGATHADELFYLFKFEVTLIHSFFETEMIRRMTTMWTNFARYGNPTPEKNPGLPFNWPAADKRDPNVLVIDREPAQAPLWQENTIRFWNATYTKFRRKTAT